MNPKNLEDIIKNIKLPTYIISKVNANGVYSSSDSDTISQPLSNNLTKRQPPRL
jgi:hypothetical protein